jgi:predicted NAD/FAD-dependent oxidoreductase
VRAQLARWFGAAATRWRHLRTYHIPFAQPDQPQGTLTPWRRDVRVRPGLYLCGDHRDNGSIDGAMTSGRRAAEAFLADDGRG